MKRFLAGLVAVILTVTTGFAFAKPDTHRKFTGDYYFQVNNTVSAGSPGSATLNFPGAKPPNSASGSWGCGGSDHICSLSFPGYKKDANGVYEPSTMPNGGTIITNYSSPSDEVDKP